MTIITIADSTTLRELDISYNDICDDGILVITETLQQKNVLAKLNVEGCGLLKKGMLH